MGKIKINSIEPKTRLFLFAVVVRIVFFIVDLLIGSLYVDEAMTTLNSFEIAKNGTDLFGDKMPLYFDTWLTGGQSPVATYFSALTVLVFGQTKFAVRLPVLITNIASLWAFFNFVDEVFKKKREKIALYTISSVSPWLIFSSALLLDCNYCAFFIAFAVCFLAKAVNRNSTVYFVLSMLCFGTCFYTYMAAVLFVPVLLITIYLFFIIKKMIEFKNVVISVIAISIVSTPFIVLGLNTMGVLHETSIIGFNISNMDYYSRQGSMTAFNGESPFNNAVSASVMLMLDMISPTYEGINKFQFSNLFGGVFVVFGEICFIKELIKKKQNNILLNAFFLSFILSGLFYVASVGEVATFNLYRYAPIEYTTILFEGLGIIYTYDLIKKLKIKPTKHLVTAYIVLSVTVFGCVYGTVYLPQVRESGLSSYADTVFDAIEKTEELGYEQYAYYTNSDFYKSKLSIYFRYYYYDKKEFINLKDELISRYYNKGVETITKDDSISIMSGKSLKGDCCICAAGSFAKYNADGYKTVVVDEWIIAYK